VATVLPLVKPSKVTFQSTAMAGSSTKRAS
jgi:hypothetical protein